MPIVLATAVMVRSKVTETWWKACVGDQVRLQRTRSVMQPFARRKWGLREAYSQVGCSHLVSCKGSKRDGSKHEELPPCWKVVWVSRIRVVQLTGPHGGSAPDGWLEVDVCRVIGSRAMRGKTKVRRVNSGQGRGSDGDVGK